MAAEVKGSKTDENQNKRGSETEYSGIPFSQKNGPQRKPSTYRNAREYAQALRPWLFQYHSFNSMHTFATNFALQMQTAWLYSNAQHLSGQSVSDVTSPRQRNTPDPYINRRPHVAHPEVLRPQNDAQTPFVQQGQRQDFQGVLLKVPTFWKRVAAELVDFTLLFYLKMIVSLFLVTEFSLDNLSLFSSDDLLDSFHKLDYDKAFAISFEVIALEIINRVLITIFETMCLYRAFGPGGPSGATPGKSLLGLKVVSCENIRPMGQGRVIVNPAGGISFKNAFLRSVIKNFTIAFFLPACLTLFFFKHNRTAYDVIAKTIVVEEAA